MRRRNWSVGSGLIVGGGAAFQLFTLAKVILLFARDAAPRLTQRWAPVLEITGAAASAIFGLAVLIFIARSPSAPALLRRIGISVGVFGLLVVLGGIALIATPMKPPAHEGRMAAGDMAAGSIVLYVLFAGIALMALATAVIFASIAWSWLRRKREANEATVATS